MAGMEWLLEIALVALLAATLFHAVRLERALGVLKQDRAALQDLIDGFNASTRQAELGIERLRGVAEGTGLEIAGQLDAATALRVSRLPWSLVVACDLPYLTRAWLEYLVARALASDADAVIAMNASGAEPLCAAYCQSAEPAVRSAVSLGNLKVRSMLENLRGEVIEPEEWKRFDSDGYLFKNMNSPEDYEEARQRLGKGVAPDAGADPDGQ